MNEILELASKLGKVLAQNKKIIEFKKAEERFNKDETAKNLYKDLEKQSRKIRELEEKLKPVEVEDKRELKRLQDAIVSNPIIQEYIRTQVDHAEIMAKVNERIEAELKKIIH